MIDYINFCYILRRSKRIEHCCHNKTLSLLFTYLGEDFLNAYYRPNHAFTIDAEPCYIHS